MRVPAKFIVMVIPKRRCSDTWSIFAPFRMRSSGKGDNSCFCVAQTRDKRACTSKFERSSHKHETQDFVQAIVKRSSHKQETKNLAQARDKWARTSRGKGARTSKRQRGARTSKRHRSSHKQETKELTQARQRSSHKQKRQRSSHKQKRQRSSHKQETKELIQARDKGAQTSKWQRSSHKQEIRRFTSSSRSVSVCNYLLITFTHTVRVKGDYTS